MENFQEIRDSYRQAVVHFLNRYQEQVSEHIIDVMISVMMTRDGKLMGGSFVKAVCNNDLKDAISRADNECLKHIRMITLCYHYCFDKTELHV